MTTLKKIINKIVIIGIMIGEWCSKTWSNIRWRKHRDDVPLDSADLKGPLTIKDYIHFLNINQMVYPNWAIVFVRRPIHILYCVKLERAKSKLLKTTVMVLQDVCFICLLKTALMLVLFLLFLQ